MSRTKKNLVNRDTEVWLRSVTRSVADHLRRDGDRRMLALYLDYLVSSPKPEQRALKDRLITQLRLSSVTEPTETNETFIAAAARDVQEFFQLIETLRSKVGPDESDLGQKLHGGELGDVEHRTPNQKLIETDADEAFFETILRIEQMDARARAALKATDAYRLLREALEEVRKQNKRVDDWPDEIGGEE